MNSSETEHKKKKREHSIKNWAKDTKERDPLSCLGWYNRNSK